MSFPSTVLVYEFFTGGGCPPGELPSGLAAEALGMLWALLADFREWGAVRTITVMDSRFERYLPGVNRDSLPADEVICESPGACHEIFVSLLDRCNSVFIIAPETDGILAALTSQAERAGIQVLGSSASAVVTAGDKAVCDRLFRTGGISTPRTIVADLVSAAGSAEALGCPLIVKPIDGMGSEGVCRVDRFSEFHAALSIVRSVTSRDQILLQQLVHGTHTSVSLLLAGDRCLPLSLNRQLIEFGSRVEYVGSEVPFSHKEGGRAVEMACSAARLIPGLRGYVGVDLVLGEDSVQVIEINPRLTTSYIGLRQVSDINLARAIVDACSNGALPERFSLTGRVTIRKDDPFSWGLHRLQSQ